MKAWFSHWFSQLKRHKGTPVTYFTHVPKTAGTSFIVLLDRFFHHQSIFPYQLWREVKAITPTYNHRFDLYRGHFGGGGVKVLTDRPIEYLTILRDPVELARSTYQYVLREKNTKVHQWVVNNEMTFAEFLDHPQTKPLVENRMIRNISFDFTEDPAAQEVFLATETIDYLASVMQQSESDLTDDARLLRAQEFIKNCLWFGIQEKFDQSMQLLCFVKKWPPVGPSQKLNTVAEKTPLTDAEKNCLKQVNQHDTKLYEFAEVRFNDQYEQMCKQLESLRTATEQSTDELLDLAYQRHFDGELQTSIEYDFAGILLGSQWHRRELMQPEAAFFRWTGPGRSASIDFWLVSQNYNVTIRIINAISVDALEQLTIKLNGLSVQWQTQDTGVVRVLAFRCDADLIKNNGLVRLEFELPTVASHAEAFGSDDMRLVGLAVDWIKFAHD
ncbi:hypothetical protein OS175_03605 [Marinicella sp. S1101]|uniref:hypothetical protein n=1 Tax=Marinicella marina TaxID=2996016 RepID=UPI002260CD07|nr:hypothetical protein [Marinicella marina]MCX7552954.1 hypothetical protein [Marinicella marina]MDJ1139736.1 hypothetical protein [Marinicella marina]